MFFVNNDYELANKIPSCQLDFILGHFPCLSTFKPPDIQEISGIIGELKISSAGHDGISSYLVKQVKQSILQRLVDIFSLSLKLFFLK